MDTTFRGRVLCYYEGRAAFTNATRIRTPHVYELARRLADAQCGQTPFIIITGSGECSHPVIEAMFHPYPVAWCTDIATITANRMRSAIVIMFVERGDVTLSPKMHAAAYTLVVSQQRAYDLLVASARRASLRVVFAGKIANDNIDCEKTATLVIAARSDVLHVPEMNDGSFSLPSRYAVALINTHNEEDIIIDTIEHYLAEGVCVHIMDNGSNDTTLDIVQAYANVLPTCVSFELVIDATTSIFNVERLRHLLYAKEQASRRLGATWFLHVDADEHRLSPWLDLRLREALSVVEHAGFTAVDFTIVNMFDPLGVWDTVSQQRRQRFLEYFQRPRASVVTDIFTAWCIGTRPAFFTQIKAWMHADDIDLHTSLGHSAVFTGRKVFPFKFMTRHLPMRTEKQAAAKLAATAYEFLGEHKYEQFRGHDVPFAERVHNTTREFHLDAFYSEFLIERLTSIGFAHKSTCAQEVPWIIDFC